MPFGTRLQRLLPSEIAPAGSFLGNISPNPVWSLSDCRLARYSYRGRRLCLIAPGFYEWATIGAEAAGEQEISF